ncbi:MAG TPA: SGNH/GDSL hydrolase family protein [Candidatus Saccharimonadales bacterium]|jgi:lysophospholipase L1-like esterase|nr:SGNH/GDSL hydrolase family protein [Candidatus Saccharimonadales bacterium]
MSRNIGLVARSAVAIFLAAGFVRAQAPATSQSGTPANAPADCAELPVMTEKLAKADKILHDWPNLGRYAEANTSLAAPAKFELRVVFMGDSITDAWVSPEYGGFFPGKPYLDRGISGQTTPQMLIRFRPDVLALQPRVVVILAGTNDIAGNTGPMTLGEIEGNLASMAELARINKIRVVLASVLPVSNYGHNRQGKPVDMRINRPPEKILELNAWIKKYTADNGHTYLDYFSAMVDEQGLLQRDLSEDGLHPNAKGYAVMSPLVEQAIRAAIKKRH